MNRKAKGNAAENWLIREFRECRECLSATRASRSLGPWDVCALMEDETWLIQIKSRASDIGTADRKWLEPLSSCLAHRMCWIAVINKTVIWQGYFGEDNEAGVSPGWYYFPDGPLGSRGTKVRVKESKCSSASE